MSNPRKDDAPVGDGLGALPIFILLGALFVAVCWWIEPMRYRLMESSVQLHPAIAERALSDESDRIVLLGCNVFNEGERAERAERLLGERPRLQRMCVSDVYLSGEDLED